MQTIADAVVAQVERLNRQASKRADKTLKELERLGIIEGDKLSCVTKN